MIRNATHFVDFMKRVVMSLKLKLKASSESLKSTHAILHSTKSFSDELIKEGHLDRESLKSSGERLVSLLSTL